MRGRPPEVVGDIFRALTPIVAERPEIKTIALPVVAAGVQGYAVATMLEPLLHAALHWLETGLPLDSIKIVTYTNREAREALAVFSARKKEYHLSAPPPRKQALDYDVFISYSRQNACESESMERVLRESRPGIKIFVDRNEIDIGYAWQLQIFESLDRCRIVVPMLSPQYVASKVCQEEYNIAWIRGRDTNTDVMFPVYLYSADLPTYMKYRNYFDCREGDQSKLVQASRKLMTVLDRP